jgi:hypothetical protein
MVPLQTLIPEPAHLSANRYLLTFTAKPQRIQLCPGHESEQHSGLEPGPPTQHLCVLGFALNYLELI